MKTLQSRDGKSSSCIEAAAAADNVMKVETVPNGSMPSRFCEGSRRSSAAASRPALTRQLFRTWPSYVRDEFGIARPEPKVVGSRLGQA